MVTLNQSWCIIKRHYGLFLPISQEANICFFASISILASIIKFFYDKKHKKLDTLLVNTGHSRFKGKEFTLSDDIVNGKGQLLIGDTFWPVETLHNENYSCGNKSYCYRHARNNS